MKAKPGQKVPLLSISEWVQGEPVNFDQLTGTVVLVEVFQVNCPGCFLYALPQAIELHEKYANQGLTVLGVATAFEDFDKNTLDNLKLLVKTGEVIGETLTTLEQQGKLMEGRLPFRIPFPLAMDRLVKREQDVTDDEVLAFITEHLPDFDRRPAAVQDQIRQQVQHYLESLIFHAETFERFNLKGTPSQILVDKKGVLRACTFGADPDLGIRILELLNE